MPGLKKPFRRRIDFFFHETIFNFENFKRAIGGINETYMSHQNHQIIFYNKKCISLTE